MERIKILVVDDESRMRKLVKDFLVKNNYDVIEAGDGSEALDIFYNTKDIALIILDVMMPKLDGWQVCKEIRETSKVPIIMLTAKGDERDELQGFKLGVDEYVTKPFSPTELLARVRAQLRRYKSLGGSPAREGVISLAGIELDRDQKTVLLYGEQISLTPTEFGILALLLENPGRVFSNREIYDRVWRGAGYSGLETSVPVHIRHLREKIEINPAEPRFIKVVWGQGYKLDPGADKKG